MNRGYNTLAFLASAIIEGCLNDLPIQEIRDDLASSASQGARIVLSAPTGSGKSTQVPQMLLEAVPKDQILVLQPRRIAARMLAARVAKERRCDLGGEVGYQVRLQKVASASTRILYITEGILLRRLLADPNLNGVSCVVFDEFHERHLETDLCLALTRRLQASSRPDLLLMVMSATLDADVASAYLPATARLHSAGRTFPVEIAHLDHEPRDTPVWELAADAAERAIERTDGHLLVFMPGAYEISRTVTAVRNLLGGGILVLPLHGEMSARDQDEAVAHTSARKVIVATNVAETSLTIEGVTAVVDGGLARMARFDPARGIDTLLIEKISRAAADQRAGRAGRVAPGICSRLWTRADHERRPSHSQPEIHRIDLSEALLAIRGMGIPHFQDLELIDSPREQSVAHAEDLLSALGAADTDGALTKKGRKMLHFPAHPRYASMLIEADELGCVRVAALAAALTQARSLLTRLDRRSAEERSEMLGEGTSDFRILMRAFSYASSQNFRADICRRVGIHAEAAREIDRAFRQLLDAAKAAGLGTSEAPASDEQLAKCVLAGFADHVARRISRGNSVYDVVGGRRGSLARDSAAADADLLVAAEIAEIERTEIGVSLSLATAIEEEWLEELFPDQFTSEVRTEYDAGLKRVVHSEERRFRDLVLSRHRRDASPGPEAAACLAREILAGNIHFAPWNEAVEECIRRINLFAQTFPEYGVPSIGELERELLLAEICDDAVSARDLKDRNALSHVQARVPPAVRSEWERLLPVKVALPSGKSARIFYEAAGRVVLRARIQELFGLQRVPEIAGARIPLLVEILAPNQRPVQVTRDLPGFWKETYPKLKAELQRRYPKHEWR